MLPCKGNLKGGVKTPVIIRDICPKKVFEINMTDEEKAGKDTEKMKKILPITAGLCVLAVIVMIIALVFTGRTNNDTFSPPPFDSTAVKGSPNVPDGLGYGEIDAKEFFFSAAGELKAENGKTDVWFTNPEKNSVWLKVRIMDEQGNVLGESGVIRPGEYVKSVKLDVALKSTLNVSLKVMAYEPETYYSAGSAKLNTMLTVL